MSDSQIFHNHTAWLTRSFNDSPLDQNKIHAISSKILLFLKIMLEEVADFNFSGEEYIEKMELFTRSVIMTYDKKDFIELLRIMLDVYPQFYTTKFYMGLVALRKVCCLEFNEIYPGLQNIPPGILPELHDGSEIDYNSIFFITHLLLNIANIMNEARSNNSLTSLSTKEISDHIVSHFQNALENTMTWIKTQHI